MKPQAYITRPLLVLLLLGSLTAFQQVTREDLRREKLQQRLDNYRKVSIENCLEQIYEDASAIVDSIMIERARSNRDTINKPPRPERPERPELLPPKDSVPVKPLVYPEKDTK